MKTEFIEIRVAAAIASAAGIFALLMPIWFGDVLQGWQFQWGDMDIEMPYPIMAAALAFTMALKLWHGPRSPKKSAE